MSQRAAPPEKKRYVKPLLTILAAYFVVTVVTNALGLNVLAVAATLAWLGGSVAWVYFAARYNAKTWVALTKDWQSAFLCHRCSHVFVPNSN